MKSKKILATLLAAMLATGVLAGCGSKPTDPTSAGTKPAGSESKLDKDQYLNLAETDDAKTLDSVLGTDAISFSILNNIMEGLAREENVNGVPTIKPAGAEKWDVSADGLVWTFHLRDHNWTDGKKVTAADYEYAWKRLLDPKTAAEYASFLFLVKNGEEFNAGKAKAEDVGIKAVDEKTFQVTLKAPVAYFDKFLAFKVLLPQRKDIVEAQGDSYGQDHTKMVYNGPFVLSQWQKGAKFEFTKNEKYWDAATVKLQKVNMPIVKETDPRMQMFEAKQLDESGAIGDYLAKFKGKVDKGELNYQKGTDPTVFYVLYNTVDKNKVFTNAKVRKAFSLVIDRQGFLDSVYKRNIPAYGVVPFLTNIGDKEYRKVVEEPLKAELGKDAVALLKEGLTELGMDPDPAKLEVTYLSGGTTALDKTIAEFYQDQWQKKLGVKVKVDAAADFKSFLKRMHDGDFQFCQTGWGADYNDPQTFMGIFLSNDGNNNGKYNNPEYDKLVNAANAEPDNTKRLELYKQAEKLLIADDAAVAPTFYRDRNAFFQTYVKNLQLPLFGADFEFKWAYTEGRP